MKSFWSAILALIGIIAISGCNSEFEDNQSSLIAEVSSNALTQSGSWLEMQNTFGEWEKVILVFGFADPGDHAACEEIRQLAGNQNPLRQYRCNPVN